jgi:Pretoxin HINT domain
MHYNFVRSISDQRMSSADRKGRTVMSGQSTGMQLQNLVDALLSDERVLTASERALLASILQQATSPTGSPQIDALVASRIMTAIGTSVFQRALALLNQVFAQRLVASTTPQTNVAPGTPATGSQVPALSPNVGGDDPSKRAALPPLIVPFFPLPPIFNPPPQPLPPVLPPLDSPNPPIDVPGIIFPPIIFNPQPPPPTPPLPPDPPAPQYPPLPPDPPAPPNFVPDAPAPPTPPGTDTDTDSDTDTDTDTGADDGDGGGDGGGGCYVTGTPVHLGDQSLKSIEQIRTGDSVLTVDGKGRIQVARVLNRTTYSAPETVLITFKSGDSVEVTPRHRFVASGTNLVRAKDLLAGDKISTKSGSPAEVHNVASVQRPTQVHNLKLEGADRFFASKAGVLGHVEKD